MSASRDEKPLVVETVRVKNPVDSSLLKSIISSPYYHQFIFCSLYQFVRMRNMLDTYVRHSMRYFKRLNIDFEQQLAQPSNSQLCQMTN